MIAIVIWKICLLNKLMNAVVTFLIQNKNNHFVPLATQMSNEPRNSNNDPKKMKMSKQGI